jgi:hypothetical protein
LRDPRLPGIAQPRPTFGFLFNPGCRLEAGAKTPGLRLWTFSPLPVSKRWSLNLFRAPGASG